MEEGGRRGWRGGELAIRRGRNKQLQVGKTTNMSGGVPNQSMEAIGKKGAMTMRRNDEVLEEMR
eukprot:6185404-Pleurochrysis_carterae.AAC.1